MTRRPLRRRLSTVTAAATVPVVLVTLALGQRGFPIAQLDLNDGGVWLTATSRLALGRYNVPVEGLDGGLVAPTASFDVLQDGPDVVLVESAQLSLVDPATVAIQQSVSVEDVDVSMAGGTIAVVDARGQVWMRPVADLAGLDQGGPPALDLGTGGRAVVAGDGTVVGVGADGAVRRVAPGDEVRDDGRVADGTISVDQLTAVGTEPVVLDGSTVLTRHGRTTLPGAGLLLQQPGPAATSVLVASTDALYEVPLDGGAVRTHATTGAGTPAAPVRVGACAYGAWSSAVGAALRVCRGQEQVLDLAQVAATDTLTYRVNRGLVVLNDTVEGRLWLPDQDAQERRPDWAAVTAQDEGESADDSTDGTQVSPELSAQCTTDSAAPTATDDELGVRAGRATVLNVLDNDSSSDCGILAISTFDPIPPEFGVLETVRGGRALQVTVAAGATGTVEATYTVADGRGTQAPSTARVRLTVHPDGQDSAPVQTRVSTVRVEAGGTLEIPVLADWVDPDGDDLVVTSATLQPQYGEVSARSDGTGLVTVRAAGTLGRAQLDVVVSDGRHAVAGTVQVDVATAGSIPPRIDPLHAVTYVDQPVTLDAVGAVRSAGPQAPRLAGVGEVVGATVTPDLATGTFTFAAARVGAYFVSFTIAAGSVQGTGLARVDVLERPAGALPPVAVMDRALLPAGGSVTVDPLANDEDPAGLVLVLREVRAPADAGIDVATVDNHLVQISSERTLSSPVVLTYVVSNGAAEDEGQIVVAPRPAGGTNQAPVVRDVEVSVRTGGVVTASVLDQAYDPDGDALSLVTDLPAPLRAGEGLLFVSGDVLRYQAPADPMTVTTTFQVADSAAQVAAGRLTVHVHSSDAATKSPPSPRPVETRVFAGESQRVTVPLTGIDEDGDGLTLLGLGDTAPASGRITAVGPDWLEYEAYADALGTDTFTYAVEDWTGQRAEGTVRVGIAVRPAGAASVLARPDAVAVRPNRLVEVPVLANDLDATGAQLSLDPVLEVPEGVEASVDGDRVVVRAPGTEQSLAIVYTAINGRGGRDSAVLTLTVANQAQVANPVASDVVVPAVDTLGRTEVRVSVLGVAANPSGPLSDLAVSVPSAWSQVATVLSDGAVLVQLADHVQTVPYLLTNTTEPTAAAYAFITVPALGFFPPINRPRAPELRVASGARLTISLGEQVQVAPGRTATVADPTRVTATRSDGSDLFVNPTTLAFRSVPGYAGPASISVPVTDSTGPGDARARTATIQLSITVYAVDDHPPTFKPFVLEVGPGDSELAVDLLAFTLDPAGQRPRAGEYTFRQDSPAPAGFAARLDPGTTTLRVSAAATTAKGTTGRVALTLRYGETGSMPVTVDLRVRASTLPTARVPNRQVDGVEGQPTLVDVLADAYNPFPASPLSVAAAWVENPASGTVSIGQGTITATPARGMVGAMVVRVAVRDVTGDADREVEAAITVRVRGVPAAPGAPRVDQVSNRTVALSWTPPDGRGEPVLEYLVTAMPGGLTQSCASTVCTIGNLTNNVEYTFTVAARNSVGWSPPGPASASARPDAVPDAPTAVTATAGDGQLVLSWAAPATDGSPIIAYTVEISPAPATGPATLSTATTSVTVTGLLNGTAYAARVRAANGSPEPGPWSSWSAPATPAGLPGPPQALTATRVDSPLGGQMRVTWQPGSGNGAPINAYELQITGGPGAGTVELSGGDAEFTVEGVANGVLYTLSLRARNDVGWSTPATATAATFGTPGVPPGVGATGSLDVPAGEASLTASWSAADGNGSPVTGYDVRVSHDAWTTTSAAARSLTLAATPGVAVPVSVRACNAAGCGPWSADVVVTPMTRPGPVTSLVPVLQWQDGRLLLSATWQAPASWGNVEGAARSYELEVLVDGTRRGGPVTTTSPGIDPLPLGVLQPGTQVVVRVTTVTDVGRTDADAMVVVPDVPAPAPGGGTGDPPGDGP